MNSGNNEPVPPKKAPEDYTWTEHQAAELINTEAVHKILKEITPKGGFQLPDLDTETSILAYRAREVAGYDDFIYQLIRQKYGVEALFVKGSISAQEYLDVHSYIDQRISDYKAEQLE